jgi:hypothetical protein
MLLQKYKFQISGMKLPTNPPSINRGVDDLLGCILSGYKK